MREVQNTGVSGYNRKLLGAVDPALGFFAVAGCLIPHPSFSSLHGSEPYAAKPRLQSEFIRKHGRTGISKPLFRRYLYC